MLRDDLHRVIAGEPFDFNETALRVFEYQYERCKPYRAFCDRRAVRPATTKSWKEIPPVPVEVFKRAKMYCGAGEPAKVFMTSGTTGGPETRGKHYFEDMDLFREAERAAFRKSLLPEGEIRLLLLDASPELNPTSALVWYLGCAKELFGAPKSEFFVDKNGLRTEALQAALDDAAKNGERVCLLGTAFAYVHALDAGVRASLPEGSFAVHMGGFKGRSRELERAQLHAFIAERLGLGLERVYNNYSMTEVSTQFYGDECHLPPHWTAVRMLDPDTLKEVPEGQRGLIAIADLINLDACAIFVTQDLGAVRADGTFQVFGRVPGAESRGCSLAMDEFLQGAKA
jgi:Acyl-protein synthetase, LuxE